MKILLIGEFSGVHNNLKKGLIELGHDVKLASDGDKYRKFNLDFEIAPYEGRIISRLQNVIYFLINIKKFIGYDVIQFINPFIIPYYFHYLGLTKILFKFNGKSVYYACGTDPAFINAEDKFEYYPFETKSKEKPVYNKLSIKYYNWFLCRIDHIVPSMYTYAVGYFGNKKLTNPIPLPGSGKFTKNIGSQNNKKVKVLYGITRHEYKGSSHIFKALEMIQLKYPEKVEVTIVEKLPFNDYISILDQTDILIDQCKSYDYGMNAIFALERGKIVMSGSEEIAIKYLNLTSSPVINIKPDFQQIIIELQKLVNLNSFMDLKKNSYDHAFNVHNLSIISHNFSKLYENN